MVKEKTKIAKTLRDTERIARGFLRELLKQKNNRALVVGLRGELGAGKTAFTQAVGRQLGIKRKMASPTFVIMKRYPIKHKNFKHFFHLDAYRLKRGKELLRLGWREVLANPGHLVFIEWPENVQSAMPRGAHRIKISHHKSGQRKFRISAGK